MKAWQRTLAVTAGTGLFAVASIALTQDRPVSPRTRTTPTKQQPSTSKQQPSSDNPGEIKVSSCYINLIDKITVAAGRGGVLAFVKPEEGIPVKEGEEIAKVKDEVAAAAFSTASKQAQNNIEIRFAEKSAEVAQAEYMKALNANQVLPGTVTEIEMKRLKLAWERAELQTENAQKEFDIAGSKRDEAGELLQTHVIESPISGVVSKVYKHTGEGVREGDPIVDVVNTDRMRVAGYILFSHLSRVKIGDQVRVNLDIPAEDIPEEERVFEGMVTYIDYTVTKVSNPQVKIYAEVINPDGLLRDGAQAVMTLYPGKTFNRPNVTTRREAPRTTE